MSSQQVQEEIFYDALDKDLPPIPGFNESEILVTASTGQESNRKESFVTVSSEPSEDRFGGSPAEQSKWSISPPAVFQPPSPEKKSLMHKPMAGNSSPTLPTIQITSAKNEPAFEGHSRRISNAAFVFGMASRPRSSSTSLSNSSNSISSLSDTATTSDQTPSNSLPRNAPKKSKSLLRNLSGFLSSKSRRESSMASLNVGLQTEGSTAKVTAKHAHDQLFDNVTLVQQIMLNNSKTNEPSVVSGSNMNSIWVMKFNRNFKYLGVGGKDGVLRLWSVQSVSSDKSQVEKLFGEMPRMFHGHTADILDISFSKNDFILSASSDKTVRLWHVSRKECLCVFQHTDFVTSVCFHPRDDRFFISGCLDSRLRLWNVQDKRVQHWIDVQGGSGVISLITSCTFSQDGKMVVCGLNNGSCVFYETDGLKYNTQIQIQRKNRGGEKVSGLQMRTLANGTVEHLLVSTNDSRVRVYNMRDKSLLCKYTGLVNESSQIRAFYSPDNNWIISGSEDGCVYIWGVYDPTYSEDRDRLFKQRRDRNSKYERLKVSEFGVTCALLYSVNNETTGNASSSSADNFIVASDFDGVIRVYRSQVK